MLLSTTHEIENKEVRDYIGLVSGDAIVGANVFKDFFAGMRDFFGGRSGAYEKTLREAREEALKDLQAEGIKMGADGVIGITMNCLVMGPKGSMIAVSATGTAVKLR